jgi:hypothetical protein
VPIPIAVDPDREGLADEFERLAGLVRTVASDPNAPAPLISLGVIHGHVKNAADTLQAGIDAGGVSPDQIAGIGDEFASIATELHKARQGRHPH